MRSKARWHRNDAIVGILAGLIAVWIAACGGEAAGPALPPPPPPPPPNRAPTAVGTLPAIELAVGDSASVEVSSFFRDPDGDALSYSAATSNAGTVTAAVTGSTVTAVGVSTGTATLTVTARDPGGLLAQQSFTVTVPNRAPERTDTIPDQELAVGDSAVFDLEGYFRDPDGDTLSYASETSDEAVATVSVSGSTLTVRAVAKGRATISVTAADRGGLTVSESFDVTAPNQPPVVTDTIPAQRLTVGEAREWAGTAYFGDPDGDALTYTIGTTDASIVLALVSGDEFGILAVTPGSVRVTVTATDDDGLSASQSFQVTSEAQLPVVITHVEPTVLLEGATATIRGSGFSSIPGNNAVLIDGLRATVTAASSAKLSITVPYADCLPPRQAELRVTVLGLSDARTVGITPLSREDLNLTPGHYKVTRAGSGCLHLPGDATGGDYLIGVVSTSEVPSSLTPVAMTSTPGDVTILAGAVAATVATSRSQPQVAAAARLFPYGLPQGAGGPEAAAGTRPPEQSAEPQRDWERHNEVMAANEELLRRLGPLPPAMARARQSRALVTNDTLTLFTGPLADCANRDQLRGVVRFVGENAVWIDDVENPSGTFSGSELAELDAFYASHLESIYDDYYGSLPDVDENNRILILMTKDANRQNLGGWVSFLDLLAPEQCGTSNHAEIFYGMVPDPDGDFGDAKTKQQVFDAYPSLIAHEVTHIVQANAAVFHGARFASWELEGGAVLAEQLVAYRLFGHGSGRNLGRTAFQLGRDWYREWAMGMAHFFGWDSHDPAGLRRIPNAPEQCSWIGRSNEGNDGPCRGGVRAVYDVPSMLFRYAMDRWGDAYPGGETALMRRLSQSPHEGLTALREVSGWRPEQVLADFYLTLWLDLNGWEAFGMTSWDLADIWSGFRESTQLRPWTSNHPAFRGSWSVRAGSTFYLHWRPRGTRGPTSLKATSPSGAPMPGHMSVWALRIR